MSNFWQKALGPSAPSPAPAAPATPSQGPWWAQPALPTAQPVPQAPVQPAAPAASPKAMSARSNETCPECGSGNIFKPQGSPNAMPQCYTCGWNPRFAHSTAGAGMPSDRSTPTRPSRQVSTSNNYNPGTIIGRIE